ncbi:hypothetical protein [Rhodococcus sp. NPDC047139]|uniref:hypothetical protein n=1 Tax=Rhodococcus sp. NPDC047139 TaxID=3155141 RepID=UPI0033D449E2
MGRITQRVDPRSVVDDLERHARAAVAFGAAGRIEALPARVVRRGDLFVGLDPSAVPAAAVFGRVSLNLDDGSYWFDLRAANLRGSMVPAQRAPVGAPEDLAWFVFDVQRVTAWDYGRLHEEAGG